jgi:hypothetical protein
MKRLKMLIAASLAVCLAACTGGGADYGKTITDHLMSKVPEGKGYKVEIHDLEKLSPVTVADSVAILQTGFEEDRKGQIEHIRGVLSLAEMLPSGPERKNRETTLRHRIDSLESLAVPDYYGNTPPGKVLAVVVRCRYSATAPGAPTAVTETFDFWLSPDGSSVMYQRRAR